VSLHLVVAELAGLPDDILGRLGGAYAFSVPGS
jgi:hypothetical protein